MVRPPGHIRAPWSWGEGVRLAELELDSVVELVTARPPHTLPCLSSCCGMGCEPFLLSRPSVQDIQLLIPPPEFLLLLFPELAVILVPSSRDILWILRGVGSAILSKMAVDGLWSRQIISIYIEQLKDYE